MSYKLKPTIENDIKRFFLGRDGSLKLFNLLRRLIENRYSPKIEVSKTQITFGEVYKYFWVWLPQTWVAQRPANSITLTILTAEKLKSKRIVESVQPRKGFWTHHILIDNEGAIDSELEDLLKVGYEFYLKRKHKKLRSKVSG